MLQHTNPLSYSVFSSHGFAEVREDHQSLAKSLHSLLEFFKGDVICHFQAAAILRNPTYLTVQTGLDEHIHLKPEFLKFTNHSCDPTVFFDTASMEFIALKDINPGDEFTFFYPSTEWQMAQPFECLCGSDSCLKNIAGASDMDSEVLRGYRLTNFIQQQLATKL